MILSLTCFQTLLKSMLASKFFEALNVFEILNKIFSGNMVKVHYFITMSLHSLLSQMDLCCL
jgi:hypothetical protein